MSFITGLFNKNKSESVILIDISAGSVAGAYAHYKKAEEPTLLYTRRVPIEPREGEQPERAMIRTLEILGSYLIREGAPALARYAGSGSADTIFVSVEAPWQETKIHSEQFERTVPFVFTKKMLSVALEKTNVAPPGKILADESVIGTTLNGYHVQNPYGKKAHQALIIVLTSFIDEKIYTSITSSIRSLFHTNNIFSIAGSSMRYQAIRSIYPYEHSALIVDAIGPLISIALVRKDFLVAVAEVSDVDIDNDEGVWIKKITDEFVGLSEKYPLPRTIFLLAPELKISGIEKTLKKSNLGDLWLSDNSPNIVQILASHIAGSVRHEADASSDLPLLLMALYYHNRTSRDRS